MAAVLRAAAGAMRMEERAAAVRQAVRDGHKLMEAKGMQSRGRCLPKLSILPGIGVIFLLGLCSLAACATMGVPDTSQPAAQSLPSEPVVVNPSVTVGITATVFP